MFIWRQIRMKLNFKRQVKMDGGEWLSMQSELWNVKLISSPQCRHTQGGHEFDMRHFIWAGNSKRASWLTVVRHFSSNPCLERQRKGALFSSIRAEAAAETAAVCISAKHTVKCCKLV